MKLGFLSLFTLRRPIRDLARIASALERLATAQEKLVMLGEMSLHIELPTAAPPPPMPDGVGNYVELPSGTDLSWMQAAREAEARGHEPPDREEFEGGGES